MQWISLRLLQKNHPARSRIQFDYYGFPRGGNDSIFLLSDPTHPVFTDPASVVQRIETVTLGINYHFQSTSAPVVAKY
jgi:hypothetical protein